MLGWYFVNKTGIDTATNESRLVTLLMMAMKICKMEGCGGLGEILSAWG